MQNIIWSISIRHNEKVLGKSKHFVTNGEELTLKIGNTSSQDIFVQQAIPNHATMELKENEFVLTAQKKLFYKIAGKRKILTKGDKINISLANLDREKYPEERVVCSIIIKDTTIKSSISKDSHTLSAK